MSAPVEWATDATAYKIFAALAVTLLTIFLFTRPRDEGNRAFREGIILFLLVMGGLWLLARPLEDLRKLPLIGKTFESQNKGGL